MTTEKLQYDFNRVANTMLNGGVINTEYESWLDTFNEPPTMQEYKAWKREQRRANG